MGIKEVGIGLIIIMFTIHAFLFVLATSYDPKVLGCVDARAISERDQNYAVNIQGQLIVQQETGCKIENVGTEINNLRTSLTSEENIALKVLSVLSSVIGALVALLSVGLYFFSVIFIGWHAIFVAVFGSITGLQVLIFLFGTILGVIQGLAVMFIVFDILISVKP